MGGPFFRGLVLLAASAVVAVGSVTAVVVFADTYGRPAPETPPLVTATVSPAPAQLTQPVSAELSLSSPVTVTQRGWDGVVTSVDIKEGSVLEGGEVIAAVDGRNRVFCGTVPQYRPVTPDMAGADVDALRACAARSRFGDLEALITDLGGPAATATDPSWFAFSPSATVTVADIALQVGTLADVVVAAGSPDVTGVRFDPETRERVNALVAFADNVGRTATLEIGDESFEVTGLDTVSKAFTQARPDASTFDGAVDGPGGAPLTHQVSATVSINLADTDTWEVSLASVLANPGCVYVSSSPQSATPVRVEVAGVVGQSAYVAGDLDRTDRVVLDPAGYDADCAHHITVDS